MDNPYHLFEKGKHMITIRNRDTNIARTRRFFNEKQLNKILQNQQPNEDIYIQKYGDLVQVLIFDFDAEGNIEEALIDAERCFNYFNRNGANAVLVKSGNKGYHLYVQIQPFSFSSEKWNITEKCENYWFRFLIQGLLREFDWDLPTLDKTNTSAGLNGNIRVVGSVHPKTNEQCKVIMGKFKEFQDPVPILDEALKWSWERVKTMEEFNLKKKNQRSKQLRFDNGFDPLSVDLRDVFRRLTDVKEYASGYCFANCLWHNDTNPSLLITSKFYSCGSCGAKGNIYTLKEEGLVDWDYTGKLEVK